MCDQKHPKSSAMASVSFFSACLIHVFCLVSFTSEQKAIPVFNNSHAKNVESGSLNLDKLKRNIQELSRIEIIRKRILESIGRPHLPVITKSTNTSSKSTDDNQVKFGRSKQLIQSDSPATKAAPLTIIPHVQEIISFSELSDNDSNDVLRFRIHGKADSNTTEAVGAYLWLLVNRRRRARRGNKGKTIQLKVEKVENIEVTRTNDTESITCLRTRVKKTGWHKMSLPLSIAQSFLGHENKTLSLKVTCLGCGRLVKLVLHEDNSVGKANRRQKQKIRTKKFRNMGTNASKPFLVINTRRKITRAFDT